MVLRAINSDPPVNLRIQDDKEVVLYHCGFFGTTTYPCNVLPLSTYILPSCSRSALALLRWVMLLVSTMQSEYKESQPYKKVIPLSVGRAQDKGTTKYRVG
jgi:hypothetical protein